MNEEILDLSLILSQVERNMKSGVCIYVQSDKSCYHISDSAQALNSKGVKLVFEL
jgi:hypothetical protein